MCLSQLKLPASKDSVGQRKVLEYGRLKSLKINDDISNPKFVLFHSCQRSRQRSSDSNAKSNEPLRRNLANSNGRNGNRVGSEAAWTRSSPSTTCPPSHPGVRPCLRKESSCPPGTSTPLRPCHPSNATSIRFRFLYQILMLPVPKSSTVMSNKLFYLMLNWSSFFV